MNERIVKYLEGNPRTKIILVREPMSDFIWVDLGKEYSKMLQPVLGHRLFEALAIEYLNNLISNNTEETPVFGEYIALRNTSILFEPELKIDIRNILEQWGKSQIVLFQISPNSQIIDDKVYLSKYDHSFFFDLNGLNYICIDN